MSLPTSLQSFQDCLDAYDEALKDPLGVRIRVADHDAAIHLRMRLHQARKLDRQNNALGYEPGHQMHAASIYDPLAVRIRETKSGIYVYIQPINLDKASVQALSEIEDEAPINTAPPIGVVVEAIKVARRV